MPSPPAETRLPSPQATTAGWLQATVQISVCSRQLHTELSQESARWGLDRPEFFLLWMCHRLAPSPVGQKQLAVALGISATQVSGLVEQLRRRGLLEGHRATADRRRQLWRLTPAGQIRIHQWLEELADWASTLEQQLGTRRSQHFGELLSQLSGILAARAAQHDQATDLPATAAGTATAAEPRSLAAHDHRGAA